jgi:predicted secreted protein
MTSSAVEGRACTLTLEGDALAESRDFSLQMDQADYDKTSRDSARVGEYGVARRDWSVSGGGLYIASDVAKKCLINHWSAGSPAAITVLITIGTQTFTGEALVTSLSVDLPYEDAVGWSFSLKGTGALTVSAS